MSKLRDYINNRKNNVTYDSAKESYDKYTETHRQKRGLDVHIPLKNEDLNKCPRCGCPVNDTPQPSLHLSSTFYECDTEVISVIDNSNECYINTIGYVCIDNIKDL